MKYLVKTTEEYWVPSLDMVKNFHKKLQEDSIEQDYQLAVFAYVEKPIKEGKEIVDSYFYVKVSKVFDDAKEPMKMPLKTIQYINVDAEEV